MIARILVATDGSSAANNAIDFAADMATRYDASIHLLSVVRDIPIPPDMKDLARVENLGETRLGVLELIANQILDNAAERAEKNGAKSVHKAVGRGDPATVIANYASSHQIGLVVMGTRGLSNVKGMLMGSVSRKLTNICEVNCLIVR